MKIVVFLSVNQVINSVFQLKTNLKLSTKTSQLSAAGEMLLYFILLYKKSSTLTNSGCWHLTLMHTTALWRVWNKVSDQANLILCSELWVYHFHWTHIVVDLFQLSTLSLWLNVKCHLSPHTLTSKSENSTILTKLGFFFLLGFHTACRNVSECQTCDVWWQRAV